VTKRTGIRKPLNFGKAINKWELEVARAAMRGDKAAEEQAIRRLEMFINRTDMADFIG
jgi:hypothetical protein